MITRLDAAIMTVVAVLQEHWLADVVGSVDDLDVFTRIQPFHDPCVVAHERGRIPLSQKGKHAEKVMGADPDRHGRFMAAKPFAPKPRGRRAAKVSSGLRILAAINA